MSYENPLPREAIPADCTCGIPSTEPLRHGWDCPIRTVFSDLRSTAEVLADEPGEEHS